MRNVKLSDEELYKLKDEVVTNIEEYMATRIFEGIGKAIIDKETGNGEVRKGVVNLAHAVSMFLDMCKPKDKHLSCVSMGELFYDHLDVFCALIDIMEEDEKERAN